MSEDDKDYIAKFRQGSGAMGMSAIDFYRVNGAIVRYHWSMGGGEKSIVDTVPDEIEGYVKLKTEENNNE